VRIDTACRLALCFWLVHFRVILMVKAVMIFLYRLIYIPALLLGLPYYAYRMWRRGGYRKGFSNRFGAMDSLPEKRRDVRRIWIQAVSVGELMAIQPLLKKLQADPSSEVVLTTTTSTGLRVLEERLADYVIWNGIFPLDFWPFSNKAWNRIQPDLSILMEGELWPEHIHQAARRQVPVLLINARLSDRSFQRHLKLKTLTRSFFGSLNAILAGSETDQSRLKNLGWIAPERILFTGNLKMDVAISHGTSNEDRQQMLSELGMAGESRLLLLGSSTWPGEETALIEAYQALREEFDELRLLIVPRHAERKKAILETVQSMDVQFHFRTDDKQAPDGTEVYIADTTGELGMLTRFADVVFVGKSLEPNRGGQTPVEAAALGKPILFGKSMSNFRDISRNLLSAGAAAEIESPDTLVAEIRQLLASVDLRSRMGQSARSCIEENQGATDRVLEEIHKRIR
jgi:3-deoxy-D-manno-octulosonic-acid transferase